MKTVHGLFRPVAALFIGLLWCTAAGAAGVEWRIEKESALEARPLDVAASPDGQWIFILVPGEIQAYSVKEGKIEARIPVEEGFDRMTQSPGENALILTSGSQKKLRVIQLEFVRAIDVSGLPYKGPQKAPVTIAVFGDYQ
jgi:hypothetical protein